MSVLNQYVAMIEESTYGTAAASARRGYESTVDGFSQEALYIDGGGRRAGRPGKSASRQPWRYWAYRGSGNHSR